MEPENKANPLTAQVTTAEASQLDAANAHVTQQVQHISPAEQQRTPQSSGFDVHQRPKRRLSLPKRPLRVGDEVRVVNTAKPILWHAVRGFREDEVILDAGALNEIQAGAILEDRDGCGVAIVLERDSAADNRSEVYAQNLTCPELTDYLHKISSSNGAPAEDGTHEGCAAESDRACSSESDDDSDCMLIEELEEVRLEENVVVPDAKTERVRSERNAMLEQVRVHSHGWSTQPTHQAFRVHLRVDH